VAIEKQYWFSALKRSASIILRSKGRSLAIFVLFYLILFVWQIIVLAIYYFLNLPNIADFATAMSSPPSLLANLVGSLLYVLYVPVPNIFLTLSYYYLRRLNGELSIRALEDIRAYEIS